jgi:hypothetical protein
MDRLGYSRHGKSRSSSNLLHSEFQPPSQKGVATFRRSGIAAIAGASKSKIALPGIEVHVLHPHAVEFAGVAHSERIRTEQQHRTSA